MQLLVINLNFNLIFNIKRFSFELTLNPIGVSAEWRQDSKDWWNTEGSSYSIGWREIDEKWYYFNSDGYMVHDTTIDGYYVNSDGEWVVNDLNSSSKQYMALNLLGQILP